MSSHSRGIFTCSLDVETEFYRNGTAGQKALMRDTPRRESKAAGRRGVKEPDRSERRVGKRGAPSARLYL